MKLGIKKISEEARAREFQTGEDMRDFEIYEIRSTRASLSQEIISRLQERYPEKIRKVGVYDRMGERIGEGPAFYYMAALEANYNGAGTEIRGEFPTFADYATHILDETDRQWNLQNQKC